MSTTIYARGSRRGRRPASPALALTLAAALVAAVGCRGERSGSAPTEAASTSAPTPAAASSEADARVYQMACARCHADGEGDGQLAARIGPIPPLASPTVAAMSTAEIEALIRTGRGAMPPHAKRLTAAQIRSAAAHVRRLNGLTP